nr:hypothetical protein [Saprospiraceae bacterium]
MNWKFTGVILAVLSIFIFACKDDSKPDEGDLTFISFDPVPYNPDIPAGWPQLEQPADNPMTQEGVQLGRRLFFDPILSLDSTISCSTCHIPEKGFSDDNPLAVGIGGAIGDRRTMSLVNVGFVNSGLFWDGRAKTLEEQALHPIEDPREMNLSLSEAVERLQNHGDYSTRFRKAFGINHIREINADLLGKALAQFQRIIIVGGESKFERAMRGELAFSDEELEGRDMFFDANLLSLDAECAHCHNRPLFTTNEFLNNGITEVERLLDHPDPGLGEVTGKELDFGKFRVPTLINWELRDHFMHDGRFVSMEDVLDHYNSGGHRPSDPDEDNVDLLIYPLNMNQIEFDNLMAFLRTLSDTTFLENPDLQDPFAGR